MSVIGTLKRSSTIMYTTLQHQSLWSGTPRPGLELISQTTPFADRSDHAATINLLPQQKPVTKEIHALHRLHPLHGVAIMAQCV